MGFFFSSSELLGREWRSLYALGGLDLRLWHLGFAFLGVMVLALLVGSMLTGLGG